MFRNASLVALVLLLASLTTVNRIYATPKEDVIKAVQRDADEHVDAEIAPQTDAIVGKFHGKGLSDQEIRDGYLDEFVRQRRRAASFGSVLEKIFLAPIKAIAVRYPMLGYVLFGLTFLALALRDALKKLLETLVAAVGGALYKQLAGNRILRRHALNRYRASLKQTHYRIKIPFRPNRPLEMAAVYIPLHVFDSSQARTVGGLAALRHFPRLMLLGPPGSGKSMFLRKVLLSYVDGTLQLTGDVIPVMIKLSSFNNSTLPLPILLAEEFKRHDFPKAENFIELSLKRGSLLILLDGLDELNSDKRPIVVAQIRDFLAQYKANRVIITCRTAVYREDFFTTVDQTATLVEFNDDQILQYIEAWKGDMPPEKSVEQLIVTLHNQPRIMSLARNPLLLTMIAYLYTDTPAVLPSSRAEFYEMATDLLLRLWPQAENRTSNIYQARDKHAVLQHLALYNQQSSRLKGDDRLSMNFEETLAQIKDALPSLSLPAEAAQQMLIEIVERSGLLLELDNGQRYQFTHLTLQEYFAASKLITSEADLIAKFKSDKDAWRETVKLWCGLARDCSTLLSEVFALDPITAFECLGDAVSVQPDVADRILSEFKDEFAQGGTESVIRAFATVASDKRSRGASAFQFLADTLAATSNEGTSSSAAAALAGTNLPEAAALLAAKYSVMPPIRAHLVRMGDLAVPALKALVLNGKISGTEDLQAIGTPQAAVALAELLWIPNEPVAKRAAWCLASLLMKGPVENTLSVLSLPGGAREQPSLEYVWQPFGKPSEPLYILAGRMGWLINSSEASDLPSTQLSLDLRVIIPLCAVERYTAILSTKEGSENAKGLVPAEDDAANRVVLTELERAVFDRTDPVTSYMMNGLPGERRKTVLHRLATFRRPSVEDWRNIMNPRPYSERTGWHFRTARLLVLGGFASGMYGVMIAPSALLMSRGIGYDALILLVSIGVFQLMMSCLITWFLLPRFDPTYRPKLFSKLLATGPCLILYPFWLGYRKFGFDRTMEYVWGRSLGGFKALLVGWMGLFANQLSWTLIVSFIEKELFLAKSYPSYSRVDVSTGQIIYVLVIEFVTCLVLGTLLFSGKKRYYSAQNPLIDIVGIQDLPMIAV
jgi:hypothetical protein